VWCWREIEKVKGHPIKNTFFLEISVLFKKIQAQPKKIHQNPFKLIYNFQEHLISLLISQRMCYKNVLIHNSRPDQIQFSSYFNFSLLYASDVQQSPLKDILQT
jgi:hypothetical protein